MKHQALAHISSFYYVKIIIVPYTPA